MLSHNVFPYVKNNPINLKDSTGFRPQYTLSEEIEEQRSASYAKMKQAGLNKITIKPGSDVNFD